MSKLNVVAREPVLLAVVASILTAVGARYGISLTPEQAGAAAGAVLVVGGVLARQLVRPTAKDQPPPDGSGTNATVHVHTTASGTPAEVAQEVEREIRKTQRAKGVPPAR